MKTLPQFIDRITEIVQNNGPDENEYEEFDSIIDCIDNEIEGKEFRTLISTVLENDTIFGHTYQKPFGYAGDFLLIEKIYQEYETDNLEFKKWDKFYHSHEATEAVRNRKKYCIQKLEALIDSKENVNVLILGCGPTTDVYEFLVKNNPNNIQFDLLDIDNNAIEYASKKNSNFIEKLNFIRANVIRFSTEKKYDLIWSAGLFDYLEDKLFVFLLQRFQNNIKANGQIIIGNFSPQNPTIKVMEVMTEWHLNYRDEEHLKNLAIQANIEPTKISIEKEPLGINLFLKVE